MGGGGGGGGRGGRGTDAYLSVDRGPHLQRVVVGAAHDAVAAELEAGDHVVVMTFKHLGGREREGGTRGNVSQ